MDLQSLVEETDIINFHQIVCISQHLQKVVDNSPKISKIDRYKSFYYINIQRSNDGMSDYL